MSFLILLIGISGISTLVVYGSKASTKETTDLDFFNTSDPEMNSDISQKRNDSNLSSGLTNMSLISTVSQKIQEEVTNLMNYVSQSNNDNNKVGRIPMIDLTSAMISKYHGIPSYLDVERRNEAKSLLENNPSLSYVGLLLPNGERYFGEPYYPYQINSSISNFAFRDHFIEAVKTKQPYLSNVLKTVTTGESVAILADPIYADKEFENRLVGVMVLGVNLTYFDGILNSILPPDNNNTRIMILDNNGGKIADSKQHKKTIESFDNLQSFKEAKLGISGVKEEKIQNNNMSIFYLPIKFAQSSWIILVMTPYH